MRCAMGLGSRPPDAQRRGEPGKGSGTPRRRTKCLVCPERGAAAGTWRAQTAARAHHFFLPRSNPAAWGQKGNAGNRGKRSVFAVRLSTLAGPLEKRGACGRGCVDIGAILLEPVAECRATTLCDAVSPFPPQQAFAASHERSLKSTRFPAVAGRPSSGGARVAASEKRSHLPPLCASHVHTRRGAYQQWREESWYVMTMHSAYKSHWAWGESKGSYHGRKDAHALACGDGGVGGWVGGRWRGQKAKKGRGAIQAVAQGATMSGGGDDTSQDVAPITERRAPHAGAGCGSLPTLAS